LILCSFSLIYIIINAQNVLTGVVLSEIDNRPIPTASVYINGTIKGVYTDSKGHFTISELSFPCQLVVSHVAYDLRTISINATTPSSLTIKLFERTNQLIEVAVSGRSRRKQNVDNFKEFFLGKDKWGKKARLKNDSVLIFSRQTDTLIRKPNKTDTLLLKYNHAYGTNCQWSKDSTNIINYIDVFKAKTKYPLHIELPLLGYDVHVDLESFELKSNNKVKTREYRTYNRFVPFTNASEQQKNFFEKNRQEVYYNSSRHFCKSIFDTRLQENGYLTAFDSFANDYTKLAARHFFDINQYVHFVNSNEIQIIGLKDKQIDVYYFCANRSKPIDLTSKKRISGSSAIPWASCDSKDNSYVTFKSDTCIIRRDGTIPDNNIMFGGKMGTKCGGTLLPNDYLPEAYQNSISTQIPATIRKQFSTFSKDFQKERVNEVDAHVNNYLSEKQQDSINRKLTAFINHFSTFSKNYPQEKTYLHFDNTTYYVGETMWFKAYVVRTEQNALSDLSKTLYVELVTSEGNILETTKLKIENGQCHGDFLLKDSLLGGFYEVRAYTRYMLNQGKDYIFSRVFAVYDKPKKAGDFSIPKMWQRPYSQRVPSNRKELEQKKELNITFFPEGGNLVRNINSKVAFKATGKNGKNATILGVIYSIADSSVAELNTTYIGMGEFSFTPGNGKYLAKVQYKDKNYTFALPEVLPNGYTLAVDNISNDKVDISIKKSPTISNELLGLSISCRGVLYGFEQVNIGDKNVFKLSFSQKYLPTGVSQITLFNASGELLCERNVFINHRSEMKIDVVQNKKSYTPFEKINLDFQTNDLKNEPVETTFSLAVKDAALSTSNLYNDNILTNLLLSSELKGYIENPGYYFMSDAPARKAALDLLLLTQGWTRYVWKQMAGVAPYEAKHPIEDGLMVEGKVMSLINKKPKPNINLLFLLTYGNLAQHDTIKTDKDGRFYFPVVDFYGKSRLTLRTKDEGKRKEFNILLDRDFSPEVKSYVYQEMVAPINPIQNRIDSTIVQPDSVESISNVTEEKLTMDKKTHLLNEVTIKEKSKFKREGEGLRNASIVYDMEKTLDEIIDKGEDEPATILDYLHRLNPYFTFEITTDNNHIKGLYKGKGVVFCLNNNSLIDSLDLKDSKPLCNYARLMDFSINAIQTITVSETEGTSLLYDSRLKGNESVIYIYTNKNYISRTSPTGIRQTSIWGYTLSKEFYNPQYDKAMLPDEKDYRRTLYWNPDVKTDTNGKAKVSFFNNGSCKTLNISAETVTENGVIGVLNK
jgi:hypothetical protein